MSTLDDAEWRIAKVTGTFLGWEDHGIFTWRLDLDYGGASQGAGLFALDDYDEAQDRRLGTRLGMESILRLLQACGVNQWEQLRGRTVYALATYDRVYAIKPLPTEPGEAFEFDLLWAKEGTPA